MGSPCSNIFSDIVMDDLESNCLNELDFTPLAYYRYVDDIFATIPRNKLTTMIDAFNSYDDRLKFTHEIDENGCISFLDLQIIRDKEKIIIN